MRRFLCAAFFAGLVIAQGDAHAQRSGFRGNAPWPDVPEITDESGQGQPNSGAGRGLRRLPSPDWPGTEYLRPTAPQAAPSPAPPTPPGSQSAQQEQAPQTQPSGDQVEERTRRRAAWRSSEGSSRPVPPFPNRFDQPSTTVGDIDPDQELQPIAAQDAEAVSEQEAEAAPVENAAVEEKSEAVPEAGGGSEQKDEAREGHVAPREQKADAAQDAEAASEQKPAPTLPVETPSAQEPQTAQKADAASEHPGTATQHPTTAEELKTAAADDGTAEGQKVENAQGAVAAIAQPAPSVPAAEKDDGLAKVIGQMIVTGFDGTTPDDAGVKRLIALLESGNAGGVVFTPRNVRSPQQLRALVEALKKANADVAPFLMVAHEGGDGQSLSAENGFSMYPSAAELGQSNDPFNAFSVYFHMAEELASYGFNVNLGPVVDLDLKTAGADAGANPRNFGSSPKHVAAFAKAFRLGHRQKGILTVLKHFPRQAGPADDKDSRAGEAAAMSEDHNGVDASLETYRQLVESDTDMVMTSHVIDPAFSDATSLPASLSVETIQTLLCKDLGFKGIVISADISDPAIAERIPLKERVVRAIGAGTDILLIGDRAPPEDGAVATIAAIIKEAVASGSLSRNRLEASHRRIMGLKQSLGAPGESIASVGRQGAQNPAAAQ